MHIATTASTYYITKVAKCTWICSNQLGRCSINAFSVIFGCFAIMLSAISALGMECVHGLMQTGKDYSNTTVGSQ